MGAKKSPTRSAAAWRLAERQHGTVARRQLLDLGFTAKAIRHRLDTGRLHQVWQGGYAVGRKELSLAGRWMATIALGPLLKFAEASRHIDVTNLRQRLPVRGVHDELDDVAHATERVSGCGSGQGVQSRCVRGIKRAR